MLHKIGYVLIGLLILSFFLYLRVARARGTPQTGRVAQVKERLWPTLVNEVKKSGLKTGAPVFVFVLRRSRQRPTTRNGMRVELSRFSVTGPNGRCSR